MLSEEVALRLALSRCSHDRFPSNVVGIICSVLTPYMVNPSAWNWKKLTAFFWVSSRA